MPDKYELVICIDKDATKYRTLEQGTLDLIDSFTTKFESSEEIRYLYQDTIEKFIEENYEHISYIKEKNKRKETGDIALIRTRNQERKRIRVLYKKHIEVFKRIIKNNEFEEYLKQYFTEYYKRIQQYKYQEIIINEELSTLIRRVYEIYKNYAKENDKSSPDTIYTEIKKRKKRKLEELQRTSTTDISNLEDEAERRSTKYKSWGDN